MSLVEGGQNPIGGTRETHGRLNQGGVVVKKHVGPKAERRGSDKTAGLKNCERNDCKGEQNHLRRKGVKKV